MANQVTLIEVELVLNDVTKGGGICGSGEEKCVHFQLSFVIASRDYLLSNILCDYLLSI
jgi:hypothetical protein